MSNASRITVLLLCLVSTLCITSSQTGTLSSTQTGTLSSTQSRSPSATTTSSSTLTRSRSQSQSQSRTQSQTHSRSQRRTRSVSPSISQTPSASSSGSSSGTPSATQSPSLSSTPSMSPTLSSSPSQTTSQTGSLSMSPTQTSSGAATPSTTPSSSGSLTATPSQRRSRTQSRSGTATLSQTQSFSASVTATSSGTPTQLPSPSTTDTPSATTTRSETASGSQSQSRSETATLSSSSTGSAQSTASPTGTPSESASGSASRTPSVTASASLTQTASVSPSTSATGTLTPTLTQTRTGSDSGTSTSTSSGTLTASHTATTSASGTASVAATASSTQSPSRSGTPTASESITPSLTQSPTPSATRPGSPLIDGTGGLGYTVNTYDGKLVGVFDWTAISFRVSELDPGCGPGRWSLTQLWLPLSQVSTASVAVQVQLFVADPSTGAPSTQSLTAAQVVVNPVPLVAAYVRLPLSGVAFDTSSATGLAYALVVSASAPVLWHSVASPTPNLAPATTGLATVNGSWATSTAGAPWSAALPFRGALLHAIKAICSPTPSETQTASPSQERTSSSTPSSTVTLSQSGTPSQTRSQITTASVTGSASASGTRSQSASQTATPSTSATLTPSPSGSKSQSGSRTPSSTTSGFPAQALLDNTNGATAAISTVASRLVGPSSWYALSFTLPEADPVCGPGAYILQSLTLPLYLVDALPGGALPLTILLYPADPATGAPQTSGPYLRVAFITPGPLAATPAYLPASLPPTWTVDTLSQRTFALVVSSPTYAAAWANVPGSTAQYTPASAFATPTGAWASADGVSWALNPPYPGIRLTAQKTACSPTPSQSVSASVTASTTVTPTTSGSGSGSGTQSPTQTMSLTTTRSASGTRSVSPTASGSATQTITGTPSPSPTATTTPSSSSTPSVSITPSGALTASVTSSATGSQTTSSTMTQSQGTTPSTTQSMTCSSSGTETLTPSGSGTGSATPSPTATATVSPSQVATPSSTPTLSPSVSQTASLTSTSSSQRTPSSTGSPSSLSTPSPSRSGSVSGTPSASSTASSTQTLSSSITASGSTTPSGTQAPTRSQTLSATPSQAATRSASGTPSGSATASSTQSRTITQTISATSSQSPSPTFSATQSGSLTLTLTQTPSVSSTPSATQSSSQTGSRSATATASTSATPSRTATATATPSMSTSVTPTLSQTASQSASPSRSQTHTASATETFSNSVTASQTQTSTATQTRSVSATLSPSATQSPTVTPTSSGTASQTSSSSPTASQTQTQSATLTQTPSQSQSTSRTPSITSSETASQTPSVTETSSVSRTPSETTTLSGSPSATLTPTQTETGTRTASQTFTPSQTSSQTRSGSPTPSATMSPTTTSTGSLTGTGTASQAATPSVTGSQGPTNTLSGTQSPGATSTPSPSPTPFVLQLRSAAAPYSAVAAVNISDSLPPVLLSVWTNRCWPGGATLGLTCAVAGATGQDGSTTSGLPVVVVASNPPSPAAQPASCPASASVALSDGVQLPFSVSVTLAFRSAGGSALLSCAVQATAGSTSTDIAATAASTISIVATPTLWPIYDDVIVVSPPSFSVVLAASNASRAGNASIAINASATPVPSATTVGTVLSRSALLRSAIDVASDVLEVCARLAPAPSTSCTLATSASDLPTALAAVAAAWTPTSLPVASASAWASFSLSLQGPTTLVLRARVPAFSSTTTVAVAGVLVSAVAASADGRWLAITTPNLQQLQCTGVDCGYAILTVATPAGAASIVSQSRRLVTGGSGNATAAVFPYLGAALSCPPFCPGLPLPANAVASVSGTGTIASYVPVALDASGSAFVAVAQAVALAGPSAVTAAAAALGSASVTGSSSVGLRVYVSQACASTSFTNPATGACADPANPAAVQCALGSGAGCTVCPPSSLCPGGTRLWPRPGFWVGSEREVAAASCALPAPELRCTGWDAVGGVTACGTGFRAGSYLCASCAPGWAARDDGGCDACPTYGPGSQPTAASSWWLAYQGLVILGVSVIAAVVTAALVFPVAWRYRWRCDRVRGLAVLGDYDPALLTELKLVAGALAGPLSSWSIAVRVVAHAVSSVVWAILALQLACQAAHASSPLLPPLLHDTVFPALGLLILRHLAVAPACAAPLAPGAAAAAQPFALQVGVMSAAFAVTAMGTLLILCGGAHRIARRIAATCVTYALLLLPAVSEAAVAMLSCTQPVRMSPAALSTLDGGPDASYSSSALLSPTAYVASLRTVSLLSADPHFVCFRGTHWSTGSLAVATLGLCVVLAPFGLVAILLLDHRLTALRQAWGWTRDQHAVKKSGVGSHVKPDLRDASEDAPLPTAADVSPQLSRGGRLEPGRADGLAPSPPGPLGSDDDGIRAPKPTAGLPQKAPLFVVHVPMSPADPVVVAILCSYAPKSWQLALLDPIAVATLGALEGALPRPASPTDIFVKAGVGASVVIAVLVALLWLRPFAEGHKWKIPVRAALLVLALACIFVDLTASLSQAGWASAANWIDAGAAITIAALSVSTILLAGGWVWHVIACVTPADPDEQAAVKAQLRVMSTPLSEPASFAISPLLVPPVAATPSRPRPSAENSQQRAPGPVVRDDASTALPHTARWGASSRVVPLQLPTAVDRVATSADDARSRAIPAAASPTDSSRNSSDLQKADVQNTTAVTTPLAVESVERAPRGATPREPVERSAIAPALPPASSPRDTTSPSNDPAERAAMVALPFESKALGSVCTLPPVSPVSQLSLGRRPMPTPRVLPSGVIRTPAASYATSPPRAHSHAPAASMFTSSDKAVRAIFPGAPTGHSSDTGKGSPPQVIAVGSPVIWRRVQSHHLESNSPAPAPVEQTGAPELSSPVPSQVSPQRPDIWKTQRLGTAEWTPKPLQPSRSGWAPKPSVPLQPPVPLPETPPPTPQLSSDEAARSVSGQGVWQDVPPRVNSEKPAEAAPASVSRRASLCEPLRAIAHVAPDATYFASPTELRPEASVELLTMEPGVAERSAINERECQPPPKPEVESSQLPDATAAASRTPALYLDEGERDLSREQSDAGIAPGPSLDALGVFGDGSTDGDEPLPVPRMTLLDLQRWVALSSPRTRSPLTITEQVALSSPRGVIVAQVPSPPQARILSPAGQFSLFADRLPARAIARAIDTADLPATTAPSSHRSLPRSSSRSEPGESAEQFGSESEFDDGGAAMQRRYIDAVVPALALPSLLESPRPDPSSHEQQQQHQPHLQLPGQTRRRQQHLSELTPAATIAATTTVASSQYALPYQPQHRTAPSQHQQQQQRSPASPWALVIPWLEHPSPRLHLSLGEEQQRRGGGGAGPVHAHTARVAGGGAAAAASSPRTLPSAHPLVVLPSRALAGAEGGSMTERATSLPPAAAAVLVASAGGGERVVRGRTVAAAAGARAVAGNRGVASHSPPASAVARRGYASPAAAAAAAARAGREAAADGGWLSARQPVGAGLSGGGGHELLPPQAVGAPAGPPLLARPRGRPRDGYARPSAT